MSKEKLKDLKKLKYNINYNTLWYDMSRKITW